MSRLFSLVAVCSLVGAVAVGCGDGGPALGTVSGIVTMDGQPLPSAMVTFSPVAGEGGNAVGTTDANGKYTLATVDRQGAMIGKHKVSVTTINTAVMAEVVDVPSDSPEYAKQVAGGSGDAYNNPQSTEKIPAKFNSQTTLEKEVTSGGNTIDLKLTST
ncbi:MAG: carboxypeptidase regulatory-like domain-containing protein [Pirellulaceae bacterium]